MSHRSASLFVRYSRCLAILVAVLTAAGLAEGQNLAFNPGLASSFAGGGGDASAGYVGPRNGVSLNGPRRAVFDGSGNLYIAEAAGRVVRVVASGQGPIAALPQVAAPVAGDVYTVVANGLGQPYGLAVDPRGNLFIADRAEHVVWVVYAGGKVPNLPQNPAIGAVYAVAGIAGISGGSGDDGLALSASLDQPSGVSVDPRGNIYIADTGNNRVRVVYGGGSVPGIPSGAAVGNIYAIAGSWQTACVNQTDVVGSCGDGGLAVSSQLTAPDSVALDASGNIYISDAGDARVRAIYRAGRIPGISDPIAGDIYTVAGNGTSHTDGVAATTASFSRQLGQVAFDAAGDLYIPDTGNHLVRKVDPSGIITTVFGGAAVCPSATDVSGDGCASNAALLAEPTSVALDTAGNLYIADSSNNAIRESTVSTTQLIFSGTVGALTSQTVSLSNTAATSLELKAISAALPFAQGSTGEAADCSGSTVLPPGATCQVAIGLTAVETGSVSGTVTIQSNALNGTNRENTIALAGTIAVTAAAETSSLGSISPISHANGGIHPLAQAAQPAASQAPFNPGIISTVAGNFNEGGGYSGDGGLATNAQIFNPDNVATDSAGNLYISDRVNNAIRMVYMGGAVPAFLAAEGITNATKNFIYTVAGNSGGASCPDTNCGDGGIATSALLSGPRSVKVDSAGNLYFSDNLDCVIRRVDAQTGTISTMVGMMQNCGYTGDGGPATSATINGSRGIFVDSNENIYFSDLISGVVRMVYEGGPVPAYLSAANASPVAGNIYTIAGNPSGASSIGDGGPALSALLNGPEGVSVDAGQNLFFVDNGYAEVREVSAQNANINAVAGTYGNSCTDPKCGDGGPAISATLSGPDDISIDAGGNLYISDQGNNVVREVNAQTQIITTIAGTEQTAGYAGDTGPATSAQLNFQTGIAFDPQGNLYIADLGNQVIREVMPVALTPQTITWNQTFPTVTYGQTTTIDLSTAATASSGLAVTYTVGSGSPATISVSGSTTTLTITGAGSVTVNANQAGNSTYAAATQVSQTFTVNKAPLTVTAGTDSVPYGTSTSSLASYLTYTVTGFVGSSDTYSGTPTFTTSPTYTATTAAGTTLTLTPALSSLAVSPSADASNYTFSTFTAGTLTVSGGATQSINFPTLASPFTYGQSPVALSATASSNLPVTYTSSNTAVAVVTGSSSTGYTLTFVGAGTAIITASQTGNTNYAAASANQVITVNRATVTVIAASLSVSYGTSLASVPFSYTTSGFISSNDQFIGPTYTTNCGGGAAYTATTPVGTNCTITVSSLSISPTTDASNYTINYIAGKLTVTQTPQTITFPTIPNSTYGSNVSLAATASSGLPITYTVSGAASLTGTNLYLGQGVGTVTVTASQIGNVNYAAAAPVMQTFTVLPAVLTVYPNNVVQPSGASILAFTYRLQGFVNGDTNVATVVTGSPVITTTATPASPPGTYPIVASLGTPCTSATCLNTPCSSVQSATIPCTNGLVAPNYTFAFVNGTLTVTAAASFIVTATPPTLTIASGQTAQTSLVVSPVGNYQGSVTFSCGQLPVNVTCTFSPATLTLDGTGNPISGTLTINTNASSPVVGMVTPGNGSRIIMAGMFLLPGCLTGLLIAFSRKGFAKYHRVQGLIILLLSFAASMGLAACGGSNSAGLAPAGTSTVVITATSTGATGTGSLNTSNSINVTLNITQ